MKEERQIATKDVDGLKKEKEAALKLIYMPGIGNKSALRLTEHAGSAVKAMQMTDAEVMEILDTKYAKNFLRGREKEDSYFNNIKALGMDFVPFTTEEYPKRLKVIPDPPFGLFVKGKLPEDDIPTVAVIGARSCSEYGKKVAYMFGKKLAALGVRIISGMARGIDGIAQRGALDGDGKTFAVLGCGADFCYPPENKELYWAIQQNGGILSEYLPGTEPKNNLFPARNRIISGLADIILVVEARKRSGTYITVMQALEQNKDVYAVPGRITDSLSEGCIHLLSQGAGVAMSPETIVQELLNRKYKRWNLKKADCKNQNNITGHQQDSNKISNEEEHLEAIILSCLEITPIDLGTLYDRVFKINPVSMQELMLKLTKMQMYGKVENSGNYYRLSFTL